MFNYAILVVATDLSWRRRTNYRKSTPTIECGVALKIVHLTMFPGSQPLICRGCFGGWEIFLKVYFDLLFIFSTVMHVHIHANGRPESATFLPIAAFIFFIGSCQLSHSFLLPCPFLLVCNKTRIWILSSNILESHPYILLGALGELLSSGLY